MGRMEHHDRNAFPRRPANTHRFANRVLRMIHRLTAFIPGGRRTPRPNRILVIRLGNLGDIIVSLPAFYAIRKQYPDAQITLLTSPTKRGAPGAKEVLARDKTFDDMIVYYEDESGKPGFLKQLARDIRARKIDHVVIFPGDLSGFRNVFKHFMLMLAAGVRSFQGMELLAEPWLDRHTTDRLLHLVDPDGDCGVPPFPWLDLDPEDSAHVDALLEAANGQTLIALQCGSKRLANRWPLENFIALGKAILERHNCWIVLPGSPNEAPLTAAAAKGIGERTIDLAGKTTIPQLAALAARCSAFVTNDTGTMHVAVAMGVPVVALYGGRDYPYVWHPYGEKHKILRAPIACSPCMAETCPKFPEPECLRLISPEQVLEAVDEVLRETL